MNDAIENQDAGTIQSSRSLSELPRLIERMHRRFLDVVRLELGRIGVRDISPVQVMMMGNIGNGEIAVRDLIERGYYLGSNASYNLKQLVDCGYVDRKSSDRDRRSARISLSPKGLEVMEKLSALEAQWAAPMLRSDGADGIEMALKTLRRLERCWSDAVRYSGGTDEEGAV